MRRLIPVVVAVLLAGCTTDDDTGASEAAGAGPSTTTVSPTTVAPAATFTPSTTSPATTTSTTTAPTTTSSTPTTTTLPSIAEFEAGLFCRDLVAFGYDYQGAVTYWAREGSPDRMDADRNGIPCQTVYAAADVLAFWGDPLPTTTVVTILYAPDDLMRFPEPLPGSNDANGSGCAPGTDSLPDGIWFGYVTARSGDALDFDLACIWTGEAAERKAAEAGIENAQSWWTSNVSGKIRSPGIADAATVYHLALDPFFAPLSYGEWRQGACHGTQDHECPVWLYVNGGKVTAIVEQFFA